MAALSLLVFLCVSSASAATLLSVDIGNGNAETGFTKWSVGGDGASIRTTTIGSYGLTMAGGVVAADLTTLNTRYSINERNRGGPTDTGALTYGDVFSDRAVATLIPGQTVQSGAGLLLQISGFEPNTAYQVQLWGYEHNNTGSAKFVDFYDLSSGTETLIGGFTTTAGQTPTTNNDFSVTGTVMSDANGNLIFKSRSNYDGLGIFNGITVSSVAAVPEPTVGMLGVMGVMGIVLRRRRKN